MHNPALRPMQTAGLLNCRWCRASLSGQMINYSHFFHCSIECKKAERKADLKKRCNKKKKKTQDNLGKSYITREPAPAPTTRKQRIEKGPRKCGKCGKIGHNVRTCKN